jgi:A118 family predicted phage portal protein
MPLPIGGEVPWPPPALSPVLHKQHEWMCWYSGNPDALTSFYSTYGPVLNPTAQSFSQQDRPKGVGYGPSNMARTFWGQPLTPGTQRTKMHVPVAADIAEMSANLLFGDMPKFLAPDATTQKALDGFQTDGLHSALREAAETCAALGGVFLRVVWDEYLADHPWVCATSPKNAVPIWSWDRLLGVTFWSVVHEDDDVTIRLLEMHEIGSISYGLYSGTPTELGDRIPLSAYEGTAGLADMYGDQGVFLTQMPWLTAVYVPNVKPHRVWTDLQVATNLGRSDYAGIESLMDALDETYTSWMRDLRLAKSRIIVPQAMLDTEGAGQGALFNLDKEVFVGVQGLTDQMNIEMNQFSIRVAEHRDTAEQLFEQIVSSAGYSSQSFGGKGDVAVTATEVQARKEQSLTTRGQKILYWRPALQQLFQALLGIDKMLFSGKGKSDSGVTVEFPAAVQPSLHDIAETLALLRQADAMSARTMVQMLHPAWAEAEVEAETNRILNEMPKAAGPSRAAPYPVPQPPVQ